MKRGRHRLSFTRDHRWLPPHASEYLDGELGPRGRLRVERHTEDCPECRELLRTLRTLIGVLGTMHDDEEGHGAAEVVLASIHDRLCELRRDET